MSSYFVVKHYKRFVEITDVNMLVYKFSVVVVTLKTFMLFLYFYLSQDIQGCLICQPSMKCFFKGVGAHSCEDKAYFFKYFHFHSFFRPGERFLFSWSFLVVLCSACLKKLCLGSKMEYLGARCFLSFVQMDAITFKRWSIQILVNSFDNFLHTDNRHESSFDWTIH